MRSSFAYAAVATFGAITAFAFAPLWLAGLLLAVLILIIATEARPRAVPNADQAPSSPVRPPSALEPATSEVVALYSIQRELQYASRSVTDVLGWSHPDFLQMGLKDLVHSDDLELLADAFESVAVVPRSQADLTLDVRTPGGWRHVELNLTNAVDVEGANGLIIRFRDITKRRDIEVRLRLRSQAIQALSAVSAHALEGSDEPTLLHAVVNEVHEALNGGAVEVYRVTRGALELSAGVGPGGISLDRRSTTIAGSSLAASAVAEQGPVFEDTDPSSQQGVAVAVPIAGPETPLGALVARAAHPGQLDETDVVFLQAVAGLVALAGRQRGAEQAAFRRSRHDELTGLVNREVFLERLQSSISRSDQPGHMLGVLLIDIDHFKIINDSLGHTAGDALIGALSHRLTQALRPGDTLARFGGDEFVVLTRMLHSADQATLAARRMQSVLNKPFAVAGHEVQVTASVGVTVCSDATSHAEALMQRADAALYRAKELGRERVELFEPAMLEKAITRLRTEEELREALAGDQLRVFYQPIVDLETGRTQSVEALVRWIHPGRGLVAPAEFIPISEATGLIEEIGAWVINESCRQIRAWCDDNKKLQVSVNVSARQVADPGLLTIIDDALERYDVDASLLAVELTETILTDDVVTTMEVLSALHDRGITIAIDDFGTGHSSVSHLRTLPIDVVKIDRSFVNGIDRSGEDYSVVAAMVQLARALGKEVVAEGVETEQQLELLRDLGCDRAQGFLFSPAVFEPDYGSEVQLWTELVLDDRR